MFPPPVATAKVTLTPGTGLLSASLTSTEGAVASAVPTTADWALPPFTVTVAGPPARPIALKVTWALGALDGLARSCCVPPEGPSVHWMDARPVPSVREESAEVDPPPLSTVYFTHTPVT